MDQCSALAAGKVVEGNQALAEAVAAAAAAEDQRHRGRGDRAIIVADEALQDARLAAPAARSGRGRDPLLVGAAKEQRHQARLVEQGRRRSAPRPARRRLRHWRPERPLGSAARIGIGDVADEAVEHRGHQRPFLLGQALAPD